MIIIYISGIDGCGKTTQATQLVDKLSQNNNFTVGYQWLRWEPSIVHSLKLVKKLLGKNARSGKKSVETNEKADSKWDSLKQHLMKSHAFRTLWLRYAANDYYRSYSKAIKKWDSDIVIIDRFIFDFFVDQSINFDLSIDEMKQLFKNTNISKIHQPDFNIIIDIPAETGFKRKMDGTSIGYLAQRENKYKAFKGNNVLHIDGTKKINEIQSEIYSWISERVER